MRKARTTQRLGQRRQPSYRRGVVGGGGADSTQATESVASAGSVESIFAVQEVPDAMDERSRKVLAQYGDDLLGRLDEFILPSWPASFQKTNLPNWRKN